jgi:hypothetical protein
VYLGDQFFRSDGIMRRRDTWFSAGSTHAARDASAEAIQAGPTIQRVKARVLTSKQKPYLMAFTFNMRAATGALLVARPAPGPGKAEAEKHASDAMPAGARS